MGPPLDLSHHFSRTTNRRKESVIKKFYRFFEIPGIGNLAGGLPNASLFPYDTLEASVALPQRFKPTLNHPAASADFIAAISDLQCGEEASQKPAAARMLVPKVGGTTASKIDVTTALQYGTAQGYPPLASFLRRFTRENLHPNVPYVGGPEIILTCGNTDGFSKALELLSNPFSEEKDLVEDREGLLVEEFAYMNAIQAAAPRGLQIVPVGMDHEGMRSDGPGGLRDVLENWDARKGKRPHLMYTVTIGQNPTSGTLSVKRRRQLYHLCHEYDIIIIEDDPYWYLQYPSAVSPARVRGQEFPGPATTGMEGWKSSGYEFLDSLVPSYLSVDTDGRVVRLDTFSKTIAPGCRLGWITAQPAFIERILRITETSTQQPSGFVQSMVAEMIIGPQGADDKGRGGNPDGSGWAVDGWVRWLAGLRGAYQRRMEMMCSILEAGKYLIVDDSDDGESLQRRPETETESWNVVNKIQMFDFVQPSGGMFVWIQLHLSTHPLYHQLPPATLSHALWLHLTQKPHRVLVAPGSIFAATPDVATTKHAFRFFRLCFAAVEDEAVRTISHRFVDGLRSFWAKTERSDVQPEEEEQEGGGEVH